MYHSYRVSQMDHQHIKYLIDPYTSRFAYVYRMFTAGRS